MSGVKMPERAKVINSLLKKFPETTTHQLARKLYSSHTAWFTSFDAARSAVRYARGNMGLGGRKKRKDKALFRKNDKAGYIPVMPPSQAEPWLPYVLSLPAKVLSLSDIHIPYHDEVALAAAVKYAKRKLKPDVVLLNGDWGDYFTISRWLKDPKKRDLPAEIKAQQQFLLWIRGSFPKAKIICKEGNHEERWNHFVWNRAPELWGLQQCTLDHILTHDCDNGSEITKLQELEFVGDQRPVIAGNLPIMHGHELPKGLVNPVSMARGAFLRVIHNILVGHGHRTSNHTERPLYGRTIKCASQGCLCDMAPEYARINRWNHGFAFIDVEKNGEFHLSNLEIESGEVK